MNQKEKMKQDLLDDIDGFFMQLCYLKDLLAVDADIDRHWMQMQKAPKFKLIVECALSDSYMLILMRLYDKSEQAQTIPGLIKKCKSNLHLFSEQKEASSKLDEFETQLDNNEYIKYAIETLSIRRNLWYAHNDKKYFGMKLKNDKTTLKRYHIGILLNFTDEVLTDLYSLLCSDKKSRETTYNEDLENLFSN